METTKPPIIGIVQRHVGERTASLGRRMYNEFTGCETLQVSREAFPETLIAAVDAAAQIDAEWILMTDGDVLPTPNIGELLRGCARLPKSIFVVEPYVFDKFSNSARRGTHLYRMSAIQEMKKQISNFNSNDCIEFRNTNRPETFLKRRLMAQGYERFWSGLIVGLHDFEQDYFDIFRTTYLYARKFTTLIAQAIDDWRVLSLSDADYLVALTGFGTGLQDQRTGNRSLVEFRDLWNRTTLSQELKPKPLIAQSESLQAVKLVSDIVASLHLPEGRLHRDMTEAKYLSQQQRFARYIRNLKTQI